MRITARQRLAAAAGFAAWASSAHARADASMSDDAFWAIIEQTIAFEADTDRQTEALAEALRARPTDDVLAFSGAFERQLNAAYTWDLWGAGYVVHGGMSDDGFEYFRRWLISKGRTVFQRVLAAPDDLADILAPNSIGALEYEEFAYVAGEVWTSRTNQSLDTFHERAGTTFHNGDPSGEPFEQNAAYLAVRYPKLWRRFSTNPLE